MKTKIITLVVLILALTSCRKYEEGGSYFLTNMSKKISGNYNFIHYYVDDIDSANCYFNNKFITYLILGYDKQNKEKYIGIEYYYHNSKYDDLSFRIYGIKWEWNNKKKTKIKSSLGILEYHNDISDTTINNGPFSPNTEVIWDVLKLKKGELILETDYNNKHYRAELKEIE